MSNNDKSGSVKLIANPSSGDPSEATTRLAKVTCCLLDLGINVDVALAHPTKEAVATAKKQLRMAIQP